MKITKKLIAKRVYTTPAIDMISLDNEISLILTSGPPVGPGEGENKTVPEYFTNDPYGNKA